jgi:hypothetical protein
LGDGPHDDGSRLCAKQVLKYFKNIGYKPKKNTLLCSIIVEENGVRGGKEGNSIQ